MAITQASIYRGTLSNTANPGGTLATLGSNTVITNIILCNKTTSDTTVSLTLGDDIYMCYDMAIGAKVTITFDIAQYVASGKLIKGRAGATSTVDCSISGVTV